MLVCARESQPQTAAPLLRLDTALPGPPLKDRAQRQSRLAFQFGGFPLMAIREYLPPPKKAVGYAVLAFAVVVITLGLGIHVAPASVVASAKNHLKTFWQKISASFKKRP